MNAKKNGFDEIIIKLLAGMETNSDIATADPQFLMIITYTSEGRLACIPHLCSNKEKSNSSMTFPNNELMILLL